NKLSVIFSDLGPQEVKNIPRPIHVYRVELEKGAAPAEVSTTLSVDGQSKEKQWRSALSPDGADVPLAHAWTRSFGKMGLIAACVTFIAAACGVGWLWISSAQQPVTTLPLSEVDLLKFLEPYVNKDGRAYHAREYAKTEIHRSLVLAPVA